MEMTIQIDEEIIKRAVFSALNETFASDRAGYRSFAGYTSITKQVSAWAETQDYSALIAEIAPQFIRSIIANELDRHIRQEAKKALKSEDALSLFLEEIRKAKRDNEVK